MFVIPFFFYINQQQSLVVLFSQCFVGGMPICYQRNDFRMVWLATKQSLHGKNRPKTSASSCICQVVLKSHKTREGASRSMAKASSNDILGLGKPLGSGPGAIRQFWNPIKPDRAPAAAWLKPAPTRSGQAAIRQSWNPIKPHRNPIKPDRVPAETMLKPFWAWGSLWDRDRRPSVSFEIP